MSGKLKLETEVLSKWHLFYVVDQLVSPEPEYWVDYSILSIHQFSCNYILFTIVDMLWTKFNDGEYKHKQQHESVSYI